MIVSVSQGFPGPCESPVNHFDNEAIFCFVIRDVGIVSESEINYVLVAFECFRSAKTWKTGILESLIYIFTENHRSIKHFSMPGLDNDIKKGNVKRAITIVIWLIKIYNFLFFLFCHCYWHLYEENAAEIRE